MDNFAEKFVVEMVHPKTFDVWRQSWLIYLVSQLQRDLAPKK